MEISNTRIFSNMSQIFAKAKIGCYVLFLRLMLIVLIPLSGFAQTAIGGLIPDPSAMLDLQSATKGVLMPRISNPANISNPATGLVIFNTNSNCLEINLGTPAAPEWESIKCGQTCGAYIAAGVRKRFMCHNLGAANFSADPFTPSWEIMGAHWQWGTLAAAAPGPTGTGGSIPNDGTPDTWTPPGAAWNTVVNPNNIWTENAKSPTDPCPDGFRVPTKAEWAGVINATLNPQTVVGSSWTAGPLNYSNGVKFGNDLFLPAAGSRNTGTGASIGRGQWGDYWSSTTIGPPTGGETIFFENPSSFSSFPSSNDRKTGTSVRCIIAE
jgi:uncharacterized protein (TIGR02145 family)